MHELRYTGVSSGGTSPAGGTSPVYGSWPAPVSPAYRKRGVSDDYSARVSAPKRARYSVNQAVQDLAACHLSLDGALYERGKRIRSASGEDVDMPSKFPRTRRPVEETHAIVPFKEATEYFLPKDPVPRTPKLDVQEMLRASRPTPTAIVLWKPPPHVIEIDADDLFADSDRSNSGSPEPKVQEIPGLCQEATDYDAMVD
jgi:hypothetical protein